jgi:hypothetical protein
MLGNKIGEETGRVTGRRVLAGDDPRYVKMEISFEANATILGHEGQDIGTYTIFERVPGQMYGEGQGIFMSADGESAIWNGSGVGHSTEDGTIMFAAAVSFQASEKLSSLNAVLGMVEHSLDMEGNAKSTIHEWKA